MHRSANHSATLIIILGILTIMIQFGFYYLLGPSLLTIGIAVLLVLLCSHIILEQSHNFESCFSYSLFNIFLCIIIILLSYMGNNSILPYQPFLLLSVIFNWLVPLLYCIIRSLMDESEKYSNFNTFYRNISIVFLLIYIGVLIDILFLHNENYIIYDTDWQAINFIPFLTLTTLIDDYMAGNVSLQTIFWYAGHYILLFLPYGFYTMLVMRRISRLVRFISLLLFPVMIEVIQGIFLLGKADIDDVIMGFIGAILGAICYFILNKIYHVFTDEDFLYTRPNYSFYNKLHW